MHVLSTDKTLLEVGVDEQVVSDDWKYISTRYPKAIIGDGAGVGIREGSGVGVPAAY